MLVTSQVSHHFSHCFSYCKIFGLEIDYLSEGTGSKLPDLVLGNACTEATNRKAAIGPIISRVMLINSTDNLALGFVTSDRVT